MARANNSDDYYDLIKSLQAKFIASLVDRSQTLEQELRLIEQGSWGEVNHRAVYIIAHQLAGTSASLGYRELGKIAEKTEVVWAKMLPTGDGNAEKADLENSLCTLFDLMAQIIAAKAETKD